MVDIFQYSNVYALTPEIRRLAEDVALQKECLRVVAVEGAPTPSIEAVFSLYACVNQSSTIGDLVRDWECFSNAIDARCFVRFGVANGMLRRVHRYPIASLTLDRSHLGEADLDRLLQTMLDGQHADDEICCAVNQSWRSIEHLLGFAEEGAVTLKY